MQTLHIPFQQQQTAGSQFSSYSQTATGSSPQILDLTRQEAKKEDIRAKQEQTEPVDFSSNTSAYTYTTTSASTMAAASGSFSTTESGNSSTVDSLNRYRSNPVNPVAAAGNQILIPSFFSKKPNRFQEVQRISKRSREF